MNRRHNYIGLTDTEVVESRAQNGCNTLTPPPRTPWWKELLAKFSDPLIIILLVAGVLSVGIAIYEYIGLGQPWTVFFEPIGIFIAIALATGLAYAFESRANKAFRILNRVNDGEPVEVIRSGVPAEVKRSDIVVGDIVIINTGNEVPADGRLLESTSLSVDESSLTGEPITHKSADASSADKEATYPSDFMLRGTKVMEGHGVMKVEAVGDRTEMGKVYHEAQIDSSVKTPLSRQLDRLARVITNASYAVAALIIVGQLVNFLGWSNWQTWLSVFPVIGFFALVIGMFKKWSKKTCALVIILFAALFFGCVAGGFALLHPDATNADWSSLGTHTLHTLMIAVTLIVVAVPEGLPMAVTLSLAYSMSRMLKTNNLVRKLHACETMGATTVICTDKTGTLTQNRMQVAFTDFFGNPNPEIIAEGLAVNSTAFLEGSADHPSVIGNPTEGALLLWLKSNGYDYAAIRRNTVTVEELPFSTERKFMATVVASGPSKRKILYVKGAPEIVYAMCADKSGVTPSDLEKILSGYQQQAMRTLGFAWQPLDNDTSAIDGNRLTATGLKFIGIAAISDPVRPDVADAVNEVLGAGINIKIVTGDTPGTAKEIGRRIGLWDDSADGDCNIITGEEFGNLSDSELHERVGRLKIIARARPLDKKRLVEALQALGEIVAVTGDGTNDAPALKTAHVGLSMGDGTSVAKEASDITIIDNSFSSIGRAVMWGRSLYKNIQRFLLFQLTVNVAACLLVLFSAYMGSESPLSVTQMLWVNLIMDTFGAMALASLPPSPKVMCDKPRARNASILTRPMMGELLSVGIFFFALTLAFYWIFTHADVSSLSSLTNLHIGPSSPMTPYEATLLFSIFVWTHFWYMFDARSFDSGQSIFRLKMGQGFWWIVAIIVAGQLLITEIGYRFFNVEPMIHTLQWDYNPSGTADLATIIIVSSFVIWVREAYRTIHRAILRRH